MSDTGIPLNEIDLSTIPRHTWVVTTSDGAEETFNLHMAIRPSKERPFWHFVEFVEVEPGWNVEQTVKIIAEGEVTSVLWVRPDLPSKEMVW